MHRIQSDQIINFKGQIRFSQSINNFHNVELSIQRDTCEILQASCDCMAGKGKCCSHAAGMAYKINEASVQGYTAAACTDTLCKWNQSTSQNVLPDTVENIRAGESSPSRPQHIIATFLETDEDVIRHLTTGPIAGIASIPGTIIHQVLKMKPHELDNSTSNTDNLPKEHGKCAERDCELCETVYAKYVARSAQECVHLAKATKTQDSKLWKDQRKIRITSSGASDVPKTNKSDPKNWLDRKLKNRFLGNAATRYGNESEPIARAYFERTTRKKVQTTGLVVDPDENWLGASLDGIVDGDTILEIKCPTDKKLEQHNGSLKQMIRSNKYDVRFVNEEPVLRQTTAASGYYYQVQVAMHCARRKNCKFLVWTPSEQVIVDVPYDGAWVKQRIEHLKQMYFAHLLPAISTQMSHGHLQIQTP